MALKVLKPRLKPMAPRLVAGKRQAEERVRLSTREKSVEWRSWYKSARWQALREQVLIRDLYRCQRTGVLLKGRHPEPDSPVVDHIKPHHGDPDLFWSMDNLQSVSKAYHDSVKQSMERGGRASLHPKWLRPSIIPLTIVCGPPASGKTTYVEERASPFDLVIDLDAIVAAMSGQPMHGWDGDEWLNPALFMRNDMLGSLSAPGRHKAAWFIVGEPKAKFRAWWQEKLKPVEIVVLETSEGTCLERVKADKSRPYAPTAAGIGKWWLDYQPRPGETVIPPT